jgi:hypothetical protein
MMEQKFHKLMDTDAILAEETILIEKYIKSLEEEGEGGAPANATGAMTSTDAATTPVLKKKDIDKYKQTNSGAVSMARRNNKVM